MPLEGVTTIATPRQPNALLHLTLSEFVQYRETQTAEPLVQTLITLLHERGNEVDEKEIRSWRSSLPLLARALFPLVEAGHELGVLLEFHLPGEARRIDVVLTGTNQDGRACVLPVELKGWNERVGALTPEQARERTIVIHGQERLHPVPQVLEYQHDLRRFNSFVRSHEVQVECAVFLPRMQHLLPDVGGQRLEQVFYKHQQGAFCAFVGTNVGQGYNPEVAASLNQSVAVQPLDVQRRVLEAFKGQHAYQLNAEQRQAVSQIWSVIKESQRQQGSRSLILIRGNAGTGKTAIALQLLALHSKEFQTKANLTPLQDRDMVRLVIPTPVLMLTLQAALPSEALVDARRLITHPNALRNADIDLLICDEAHRVKNNTLMQLIENGRTVVLFYDEGQIIRTDEGTTLTNILNHHQLIREKGRTVRQVDDLTTQMRCSSPGYVAWVNALLAGAPPVTPVQDYSFNIVEDIDELERHVPGETDRMVAGFCWAWASQSRSDVVDIRIDDWEAHWNPFSNNPRDPADHLQVRWARDETYKRHVGCIYTAQGLEFPRVAVIWGNDVVWRGGEWRAQLGPSSRKAANPTLGNVDATFNPMRVKGGDPQAALRYLLNIYRVLLTRGQNSTAVYFTDAETRRHVQDVWAQTRALL